MYTCYSFNIKVPFCSVQFTCLRMQLAFVVFALCTLHIESNKGDEEEQDFLKQYLKRHVMKKNIGFGSIKNE